MLLTLSQCLLFEKPKGICLIIVSLNPSLALSRVALTREVLLSDGVSDFVFCLFQHFNKCSVTCHYDLHAFAEQFFKSKQIMWLCFQKAEPFSRQYGIGNTHRCVHAIACLSWTHMFRHIQENKKKENRLDNEDMEIQLTQTFAAHVPNSVPMQKLLYKEGLHSSMFFFVFAWEQRTQSSFFKYHTAFQM